MGAMEPGCRDNAECEGRMLAEKRIMQAASRSYMPLVIAAGLFLFTFAAGFAAGYAVGYQTGLSLPSISYSQPPEPGW